MSAFSLTLYISIGRISVFYFLEHFWRNQYTHFIAAIILHPQLLQEPHNGCGIILVLI